MKRFKRYLKEQVNQEEFDSFTENIIKENRVDPNKAKYFVTDGQFDYKSPAIYRVEFFPEAVIMNLAEQDGTPNRRMITQYLVKAKKKNKDGTARSVINPDEYKLYSKSLAGLDAQIKTPGLFSIVSADETGKEVVGIGVVFSVVARAALDLSGKYSKTEGETYDRLKRTQEVIAYDDLTIKNIDALYYMADNGWFMETNLDEPLWEPGEETTVGAEEDETGEVPEEPPHDMTKFK
jgi:hypothetical protein